MKTLLFAGLAALASPLLADPCPLNLLGETDSAYLNPRYMRELQMLEPFYLADHRVGGRVLFPGAGFVMNSLHATLRGDSTKPIVVLTAFKVRRPLELFANESCRLETSVEFGERRTKVSCESTRGKVTELNSVANLQYSEALPQIQFSPLPPTQSVSVRALYETLELSGLNYGPNFRLLQTVKVSGTEVSGSIALPEHLRGADGHLNPAVLDAALQSVAGFITRDGQVQRLETVGVPMMFGRISWDRAVALSGEYRFRIRIRNADELLERRNLAGKIEYDLELAPRDGKQFLIIEDGVLVLVDPAAI